ncbi:MAG: RHS repeat-associated core domain-containing protein [Candidatus Caldarchaeum sp.]
MKRTEYVFDGLDPVAEYRLWNGQRAEYYRGGRESFSPTPMLLEMRHFPAGSEGQAYWYHLDGRGSVAGLTKHQGQSTHNYRYDAYGQVLPAQGNWTDPHNHYTFLGKELDEHLGLYEFGVRLYDPWAGLWLTREPLPGRAWEPRTWHRYQYAFASPISYYDPYGMQTPVPPQPVPTPPPYTPTYRPTATPGPSPTPTATPAPQPVPTPPRIPTPTPNAPAPAPTGANLVDECVRFFGLGAGDTKEFHIDITNWDIWIGRITYRYGVRVEVKGQGSPITIFPDRFVIGPLTVTKEGKITTWTTFFNFSSGPINYTTQIGLSTYPFDFSSWQASLSGRGKTELEGEKLSVSISQTMEMEVEIRPVRLAVAPIVVVVAYHAPQYVPRLIEWINQVPQSIPTWP